MLKATFAILLLGALCVLSVRAQLVKNATRSITQTVAGVVHAPGDLIFEDNFDKLDFETWQHEITMSGGGNWEFQVYHNSRENSYARDGVLYLKPTLTSDRHGEDFLFNGQLSLHGGAPADECTNPSFWGCERTGSGSNIINPTMSARIRTVESFYFKYGRVEVRAKLPAGDWLWPAIWLLPRYNAYGTWPASGEIDLMESRGNRQLFQNGVNIGTEQISQTLHYGPYYPYNGYENAHFEKNSPPNQGYDRDFHTYGLEWTESHFTFTIDGVHVGTIVPPAGGFWEMGGFPDTVENPWKYGERMAPFDQKFYLIINLAVGGTTGFFPDTSTGPYPKPWLNTSPNSFLDFWNAKNNWLPTWNGEDSALQVDYVRVWAV
jgi:hypothetical protein